MSGGAKRRHSSLGFYVLSKTYIAIVVSRLAIKIWHNPRFRLVTNFKKRSVAALGNTVLCTFSKPREILKKLASQAFSKFLYITQTLNKLYMGLRLLSANSHLCEMSDAEA